MEKYQSMEADGECIDWYVIKDHRRYTDKFTPAKEGIETGISEAQDGLCSFSVDMEERLAEIEDALCEISK